MRGGGDEGPRLHSEQGQHTSSRRLDHFSKITFPEFFPLFVQKRVTAREADERGRGPEDDNLE